MSLPAQHDRISRNTVGAHSPYDDPLTSDSPSGGVAIQCQFCPCQRFRRSRVRSKDWKDIFLMRYPVRCLRCGQRQTVSYTIAAVSVPSHIRHKNARIRSLHTPSTAAPATPPAFTDGPDKPAE